VKLVYDPTEYAIHFFAIPGPRQGKTLHAVCDFLNEAVATFASGPGKDPPPRIRLEDFTVLASERLALVPPTKQPDGLSLELDVRTLHDAVMLRTTALHKQEKPFLLKNVTKLKFSMPLPRPQKGVPNYLGVFRVMYVETDEQDPAKRAEVGKELAEDFKWAWLTDAEPISTPVGTMLFGVRPRPPHQAPEAPSLDLLFVGGRDAAEIAERYPLHPFLLTLPELGLCHLKVRNSVENLYFDWLPKLAERETGLRDLLPKEGDGKRSLLGMLDRNDALTTRQAHVVDAVVRVREELRTMRVNRDLFATASSAPPFDGVAEKLHHLLIGRWMRGTELQAENDIGYSEGALQQAKTHFKSIEASAEADQARELRSINRWVIVLAVLQLLAGVLSTYLAWKALAGPPPAAPQVPANAGAKAQ
jgi:hypothetical protein